jgi:hypothetical protein
MMNYSKEINLFGEEIIVRDNGDGTFTSFAADPANSDYQRYLNPEVEHLTEIPTPPAE